MYNSDIPSRAQLPSTVQLNRSTLLAAITAAAILTTVVLPAEYAMDPTGVGRLLGLTEMGEIKQQLAAEAAADAQPIASDEAVDRVIAEREVQSSVVATPPEATERTADLPASISTTLATELPATTVSSWRDEVRITLSPGEGTEWKLIMDEGAVARFAWIAEGGPVNYDTHGDGGGRSISYEKGRGVPEDQGELEAAFDGNHGWFFRNRNDRDITLVLRTGGDYKALKRML